MGEGRGLSRTRDKQNSDEAETFENSRGQDLAHGHNSISRKVPESEKKNDSKMSLRAEEDGGPQFTYEHGQNSSHNGETRIVALVRERERGEREE